MGMGMFVDAGFWLYDAMHNRQPREEEAPELSTITRVAGGAVSSLKGLLKGPGKHTIKSPVLGSRANELLAVKEVMKSERVLRRLQQAIYKGTLSYLIPIIKKDEADEIAKELFLNYISKYADYGFTEQNIVEWSSTNWLSSKRSNITYVHDGWSPWSDWYAHAMVETRHEGYNEKYNRYAPPHVVAYHELMHVEEMPPNAEWMWSKQNGNELLTTLKTIILLDTIYKKIYGMDEAAEVDYHQFIDMSRMRIPLGEFANFYREQEAKQGKLYLALISPESIQFLSRDVSREVAENKED